MKTISKEQLTDLEHLEIINTETHHEHELVMDKNGVIRWKPDHEVCELIKGMNFNNVIMDFITRGLDKNCEEYRKLYRDIGYSLDGYWEIFYWEINNPVSYLYTPNEK